MGPQRSGQRPRREPRHRTRTRPIQIQLVSDPHTRIQNSGNLKSTSPSNIYTLANVFMLAHPYGTPTVLSGYSFLDSNTNAGPPNGGAGTCAGSAGANGWLCQHRWQAVAGMVGFRNAVGSAAMADWTAPEGQRIAFGRGACDFLCVTRLGRRGRSQSG